MLQYSITGLAGIVLGIVGMRLWAAQDRSAPGVDETAAIEPVKAAARDRRGFETALCRCINAPQIQQ
jgi:hypothetical protein